ncbi:PREDICTED: glutathione S-transferase U17 [Tarenaya hassleriana]|uniref:glutathione S-transferase U17 n=1 Tax=Tarenaya hassleriana TaxID=28532 RepID=UPI00053C3DA4|nr:PREDICTED: glutathione S-transferase U17 [Tarenaya hassleriana]
MATGCDVKLIGAWASPFVMRPRIALNLKSVRYEFLEETFGSKSELLLKSNPVHKKIPVLIHADKPVCESLIIVQYIDEAWSSSGPSLLPSDPYDRAVARFWAAYIDEKWFPSIREISKASGEEAKKAAISRAEEGTGLVEKAFVECSRGKPFFNGDNVGYLDIAVGSFLGWLRVTELMSGHKLLNETNTPSLTKWAERFCNDSAVKPVMPETEKLADFAKKIFSKPPPPSA